LGVGRNDFCLIGGPGRPLTVLFDAIGVREVFVGPPDKGQARDGKKVDLPCLPGVRFGPGVKSASICWNAKPRADPVLTRPMNKQTLRT